MSAKKKDREKLLTTYCCIGISSRHIVQSTLVSKHSVFLQSIANAIGGQVIAKR